MTEKCPSTRWADAGGGSCTDTPRGEAVGAAWDLTESVGLMREASRRGFARDRVLERSARRVFTRRSVAPCGERRGVGWATLGYHSGRNARECGGTSLVPAIFTKFMTESLPLCPLLGGGAAKGDTCGTGLGAVALEERGGYLRTRDSGRDIPMAVKRGEPKRTVESRPPPLHPDTRLNASQDGF